VVTAKEILALVDSIVSNHRLQQVILFGSYAYGTPTQDSDVDLLVLRNFSGTSHQQYVRMRIPLNISFSIDLLVRRPAEVRRRIAQNDFFLQEVIEKGIVLYDTADEGMGAKGRKRLRRRLVALEVAKAKPVRSDLFSLPAVR